MNMKAILYPKLKKNKITRIEDSSSEEDPKIKLYGTNIIPIFRQH